RLRRIFRSLGKPANLAGRIVRPHRNGLAHGKPPQFAILNHAAIDSGIPKEPATQRLGIRAHKRRKGGHSLTAAQCHERSLPLFAERVLRNIGSGYQSALMLRARMTLPHFSVSSAMSLPKSAGETTSGVTPKTASRAFILGSARPALISLLSLSMISAGVF